MPYLLEIKNLHVQYQTDLETVYAVNGVNLHIEKGKTLGLVGETGAGKTTTSYAIMRLLPERTARIKEGEIIFNGPDLLKLSSEEIREIRGEKISIIFQDPMTALNPIISVGDQIAEALKLHNKQGKTEKEIRDKVDEVLEMVGIPKSRGKDYPHQFSGGMKQRVIIAIALACEPELLIADEPTTALDVTIQAQVLAMMNELKERLGTSMIMITHDLGIVANTCDDVAIMYAGEIIEYGTIFDIYDKNLPHHPYTVGLFGSIPNLDEETEYLHPIDGIMADPTNLPKGCNFSPRCPHATSICHEVPPKTFCNGTHQISCHLFAKEK